MKRAVARILPRLLREWVAPVFTVMLVALLFFIAMYALDVMIVGGGATSSGNLWQHFVAFDADRVTDALPALGMTIVASLGIILTVVAIIVQLSSERYTGVALMFLRDRTNIVVMCFFVVASLYSIWLSVTLQEGFVPRSVLLLALGFASLCLALMLPYFAYVFWFLEPGNIIDRLRMQTSSAVRCGLGSGEREDLDELQARVLEKMEEMADIANNSIDGRDKIVAGRAVDALRDFLLGYVATKPAEDRPWYAIGAELRASPNFVAMDRDLLEELERDRLWVEWKTLRQLLGIYDEALGSMEEISSLVAINTRYAGEAAARESSPALLRMVFWFMNSYLRSAINHGSVVTAYNVMHQYRMLLESALQCREGEAAFEGVAFLKYYGHMGARKGLIFVTETAAYDIAALCRFAHERDLPEAERLLRQFLELEVHGPTRACREERTLRGVRKAQVKLAAYYLAAGDEPRAQLIADDMRDEPPEALALVRADLARARSPHFWEVVNRGVNFEYLPDNERAMLEVFFQQVEAGGGAACGVAG